MEVKKRRVPQKSETTERYNNRNWTICYTLRALFKFILIKNTTMSKKPSQLKSRLHPRNKNIERYDLDALVKAIPSLKKFVTPNKYGDDSVDFSNPEAVKSLNKALLHYYYGIEHWDFPDENLTPPIPGRADYLHHLADVLREHNFGKIPTGAMITCFDIGTGASCIYPILGVTEYDWNFIASDIDPKSIASAEKIVAANPSLKGKVELKLQENPRDILFGIIPRESKIDLAMCNPPFHASVEDAEKGSIRKVQNLTGKEVEKATLNFAGKYSEMVTYGGEYKFIHNLIRESKTYAENCYWFSTLVSKQSNVKGIQKALRTADATEIKTIPMGTGNKSSRIIAWTFLSKEDQKEWKLQRWKSKSGQ